MNETLYYEPECDDKILEYINPDWDDDVLYNLICANQDALVDVDGSTMTLSAAMNEHPGPWIPENEANLVAYAAGLLASTPIEFAVPEEEIPDETENEQTLIMHQLEDSSIQEVVQLAYAANKPEKPEQQKEKSTPLPLETPIVSPVSAEAMTQSSLPKVTVEASVQRETVSVHAHTVAKDDNGIVSHSPGEMASVLATARSIEVEQTYAPETSQPQQQTLVEMSQADETVYVESDTVIDTIEPINVAELIESVESQVFEYEYEAPRDVFELTADETLLDLPPNHAVDTVIPDQVEVTESDQFEPINVVELTDKVADDESSKPQVFEDEYEAPRDVLELTADETLLDLPPNNAPGAVIPDRVEVTESAQFEPINLIAAEVESNFMQLTELIESNTPEDNEEIDIIMHRILEALARLDTEAKEEWEKLYTELFEEAGVAYSPEVVESLSSLTIKWGLTDEIEKLKDTGYDTPTVEDRSARMMVRKLLVAITNIIQTIRHIFVIGTYALRLYLAPRVGYQ